MENYTITKELQDVEQRIERGKQGFADMICAYQECKEKKLYKDQYGTWENYLKVRWGISKDSYYNLLKAKDVNDNLKKVYQWSTFASL